MAEPGDVCEALVEPGFVLIDKAEVKGVVRHIGVGSTLSELVVDDDDGRCAAMLENEKFGESPDTDGVGRCNTLAELLYVYPESGSKYRLPDPECLPLDDCHE